MGKVQLVNKTVGRRVYVTGDANRLQQVMTNVIGNAVKFTPKGTVTVTVQDCDDDSDILESMDARKRGMILVSVHDEGRGIPADKLPSIFDSFNRGEEEGVRSIRGTGLGLALCKTLVESHGGLVSPTSTFVDAHAQSNECCFCGCCRTIFCGIRRGRGLDVFVYCTREPGRQQ